MPEGQRHCAAVAATNREVNEMRRGARGIITAGLCVLVLAGCQRPGPEEALRRDVAAFQSSIEARDAGRLADGLADDFIGPEGLDRAGARRLAALEFMRNAEVGVHLGPLQVSIRGQTAQVEGIVVLTGGGALPARGQAWRVQSSWRQTPDGWKLVAVRWTPVLDNGLAPP
jgi:ketosteroid isomerase-like protein